MINQRNINLILNKKKNVQIYKYFDQQRTCEEKCILSVYLILIFLGIQN